LIIAIVIGSEPLNFFVLRGDGRGDRVDGGLSKLNNFLEILGFGFGSCLNSSLCFELGKQVLG